MSGYDATLSITLPADLADIAAAIGRALDPDIGGADSFSLSADGLTISTSTPCTSHFLAQAEYMLTHPEALHAAVSQDYAARWVEFEVPTLEEVTALCSSIL